MEKEIDDLRSEFYKNLYEDIYNSQGYNKKIKWSPNYGGLIEGILKPSGIEYNSLLDVGCTSGIGLEYFRSQGKEVYGIDPCKSAIEEAKSKGLNCKVASATKIPYPDNFVDLVISTETMEHLKPEDQETAFKEMFRVSKRYNAHQISANAEINSGRNLHLTCWKQPRWIEFIKNLNLEWDIIYTLTKENWEKVRHNVYSDRKDYNGQSFAYYKPDNSCPDYESRINYAVYLVLEKKK